MPNFTNSAAKGLLPIHVSDEQYTEIFDRLCDPSNLDFSLMTKSAFIEFIKYNIPAIRCAVSHVSRWLIPSIDKE